MRTNKDMVAEFRNTRMKEYEMLDLGLMRYFLGIEVKQSPGNSTCQNINQQVLL
jgi:hypothetical protein